MRKQKEKWNFRSFSAFCILLILAPVVVAEGFTTYRPAAKEAAAMEQMKINANKEIKEQYIAQLEKHFEDYKRTSAITELDMKKIRIMEQYLIEQGGTGGKLEGRANDFMNICKFSEVNLDPLLLWSITIHETGAGHSQAIKQLNNVGGIFYGNSLMNYKSVYRGIVDMALQLRYNGYYDNVEGFYTNNTTDTTIEQLGAIYCPIGATNDPTGLNKHWIPTVKKHYKELTNRYAAQIKL